MSKRVRHQSHYSQAHTEPPNAAERVFSYPYLARDIVKWAGLSAKTLRAVHPSVHRLEVADSKFRDENNMLMPDFTIVRFDSGHEQGINFLDASGNIVRVEKLWSGDTVDNLVVRANDENGGETEYKKIQETHTAANGDVTMKIKYLHDRTEVLEYRNGDFHSANIIQTPYVSKNLPLDPTLWRR